MAYNPKTGKGLGRFYSAEHRAFRAREWRGFRDTFYDFFRWLYLYGFMAAKLGCHPVLMVKAMLRYRWMVSYLTASHMVDRHTMGLRGKELRYAHNQFFSVLHNSVLGVRDIIVRDKNLRPNSKRAAKLRENTVMFDEMTPHLIMMGFPTVKWIDIAMFAVGLPSEVDQNASMFYIDAMEHLGLPADVCPEPAAECGVAVVDDYPRVGKCYFTGTMPCDGAISQTNILTRHFKDLPSFQITPPQRVNEPEVQTYAVKNLKKGIEFLEQQFGVKWDWDAFWKNAEMYNDTSRCMVEKWDVNCTDHPQVCGAALALQREYEFMAAACMDKFMHKTDLRVTKMMLKGYEQDKAANAPQPKYRCLVWACRAHGCRPRNIFFAARGAGEKDGTFFRRAPCGARLPSSCSASGARSFQSTRPLRGATAVVQPAWPRYCHFNPRTPCGVRPRRPPRSATADDFNPRTPCGVRPGVGFAITSASEFQSTHPLRGATGLHAVPLYLQAISIHAPLAGCDRDAGNGTYNYSISIHAPLAGCDVRHWPPVAV